MNTQQINNNEIHTKVQFGSEIRRFVLPTTNFEDLISILKTLFGTTSTLKVRFLDEEEDWITISTDYELAYAVEIATSPLRLRVELLESATAISGTPSPVEEINEFPALWKGGKGRNGFGRGPCRRGRGRVCKDRLEKSERLSQKIQNLQSKTAGVDATSAQNQVLLWRLQKLQAKLEMVEATKQSSDECHHHPHPHCHAHRQSNPGFRGRGGRGPRGGHGKCNHPPHAAAGSEVWKCKQNLIAARKSGNKEEVALALAALRTTKQASKEQRSPEKSLLLVAKKEAVIGARKALIEAREKGDKADVKACQTTLLQAKLEFKQAKWDSHTQ